MHIYIAEIIRIIGILRKDVEHGQKEESMVSRCDISCNEQGKQTNGNIFGKFGLLSIYEFHSEG